MKRLTRQYIETLSKDKQKRIEYILNKMESSRIGREKFLANFNKGDGKKEKWMLNN